MLLYDFVLVIKNLNSFYLAFKVVYYNVYVFDFGAICKNIDFHSC